MRVRSVLTLVCGVGLAGGSVMLADRFLDRERGGLAAVAAQPEIVDVLVARLEVPGGAVLTREMLGTQSWPAEAVPADAFTSIEDLLGGPDAGERRARTLIAPGEVIMVNRVTKFGERLSIAHDLKHDRRAMAVSVDAVSGVGGFVAPGDRVDVVLTQGAREALLATTILQDIRVVGVDQTADQQAEGPRVARTVTMEVSAEQAQRLALGQAAGKLSLILRDSSRSTTMELPNTSLRDLLRDDPAVAEMPQAEQKMPEVRIYRGRNQEVVEVQG